MGNWNRHPNHFEDGAHFRASVYFAPFCKGRVHLIPYDSRFHFPTRASVSNSSPPAPQPSLRSVVLAYPMPYPSREIGTLPRFRSPTSRRPRRKVRSAQSERISRRARQPRTQRLTPMRAPPRRTKLADRCSSTSFSSSISFTFFRLRALELSCLSFSGSRPLISITSRLFCKNTGGGIPPQDAIRPAKAPCRAQKAQKCPPVSPVFATLTHSAFCKSFACHSYANTRDDGASPHKNLNLHLKSMPFMECGGLAAAFTLSAARSPFRPKGGI